MERYLFVCFPFHIAFVKHVDVELMRTKGVSAGLSFYRTGYTKKKESLHQSASISPHISPFLAILLTSTLFIRPNLRRLKISSESDKVFFRASTLILLFGEHPAKLENPIRSFVEKSADNEMRRQLRGVFLSPST
jgi:hypothetical protein